MKRVKIEIKGMTCANCEGHVAKELKRIGAKDIKMNYKEDFAIFSIEDNVSEEVLKQAVKNAGYVPQRVFFRKEENKGFFGKLLR